MSRKKKKDALQPQVIYNQESIETRFIKAFTIFFLAALIYIPVMSGGYIYDDDNLLYQNPAILRGRGFTDPEAWRGLASIWLPLEKNVSPDYFPMTLTSFWIEWRLWGNNDPEKTPPWFLNRVGPAGYHTTNILLHAGCAVLLWLVFLRLNIPGAWAAALIWAVHPVCAESVAWISERKNTLSMIFFLWAMLAWLKFRRTGRTRDYCITFFLVLVAMLAKTAIVMVPFVLLLHIWWEEGWSVKLDRRHALLFWGSQLALLLWAASGAVLWVFRLRWHMGDWGAAVAFAIFVTPVAGFIVYKIYQHLGHIWREMLDFEGALFVFVCWCAVGYWLCPLWWPYGLVLFILIATPLFGMLMQAIYRVLTPIWRQVLPFFIMSFVLGVVTTYLQESRAIGAELIPIGGAAERIFGASFALGFYIYKIFVPLHLSLIYPQWHKTTPYILEAIPGILYLAAFIWAWRRRETWGRHFIFAMGFFVIMLVPILGLMKIAYLRLTLVADHFQYTAMVSVIALVVAGLMKARELVEPQMRILFPVVTGAALAYCSWLTWERANIFQDERRVWKDTLTEYPDSWQAHSHMGALYYKDRDYDNAMQQWSESARLAPYLYEVHNNYALVLNAKGEIEKSLEQFNDAVTINPDQFAVRTNYTSALFRAGAREWQMQHFGQASVYFQEAIDQGLQVLKSEKEQNVQEDPGVYEIIGEAYFAMNKLDDAIKYYEEAVKRFKNLTHGRTDPSFEDNLRKALMMKQKELEGPGGGNSEGPTSAPAASGSFSGNAPAGSTNPPAVSPTPATTKGPSPR